MPSKPLDILNFAESLAASDKEVELRSSISRAYYAAYHTAKLYTSFLPLPPNGDRRGGTHKQLIDRFLDLNSDSRLRGVGYILQDMCTHRETADYNLDSQINAIKALTQVESAKRLVDKLSQFSASHEKDQA
jgi:uncharacterized protein (UPF0332 family)